MRTRQVLSIVLAIVISVVSIWFLAHAFAGTTLSDVEAALARQPAGRIVLSTLLTAVSYVGFASFDVAAAGVVAPGKVDPRRAAFVGAASNAVAATLGFQAITATAVRLRVYGQAGLGLVDIACIAGLSTLFLALGFVAVLAGAFLVSPGAETAALYRAIGLAMFVGLAAYLLGLWRAGGRISIGRWRTSLPSARQGVVQLVIAAIEMVATIAALWVLMPADLQPSFATFCVQTIGATLLGMGSRTPGGLGVFEASMTTLSGGAGRADLLAALLLYRLINNLLPFLIAAIALITFELGRASRSIRKTVNE